MASQTGSAVAALVRADVRCTPTGSFVHTHDLVERFGTGKPGGRGAVDAALHRLRDDEPLVLVRPGVYFKGKATRFGPTRPEPLAVAYELARRAGFVSGVGPAGYSAARALGLTTQVPARVEVAVPGRPPADTADIHFTPRAPGRRAGLRPLEVAVLETLRDWPRHSETSWEEVIDVVRALSDRGHVRPDAVVTAATGERHVAARERAQRLRDDLPADSPGPGRRVTTGGAASRRP